MEPWDEVEENFADKFEKAMKRAANKFVPHQGEREMARRRNQMWRAKWKKSPGLVSKQIANYVIPKLMRADTIGMGAKYVTKSYGAAVMLTSQPINWEE